MRIAQWSCLAVVMAVTRVAAAAETAGYVLEVEGTLPFRLSELAYAVGARVTLADDPRESAGTIKVAAEGPGFASVTLGERSRIVKLGKKTGAGAARIVALAVSDLVLERAEMDPIPPEAKAPGGDDGAVDDDDGVVPADDGAVVDAPEPERVADEPSAGNTKPAASKPAAATPAAERPPAPAPAMEVSSGGTLRSAAASSRAAWPSRSRSSITAIVMPGLGVGFSEGEPMTQSLEAGVTFPSWFGRTLLDLSLASTPTEHVQSGWGVSMLAATLRASAGFRAGMIEAHLGPSWTLFDLAGYGLGSLFGVGGRVMMMPPITRRLHVIISGGLDLYLERIQVNVGGETAFSTPRFGATLAAGMGWSF